MDFTYTQHALTSIEEREIQLKWIIDTIKNPELRLPDQKDPEVERFFCRIPDFENRVLRVCVNTAVEPWRIVSVFFDRRMKGQL